MSIRVQCGQCSSVMSVRDEYAGTERRCPKCQGKFKVPAADAGGGAAVSDAREAASTGDEFDPVEFLTGAASSPGPGTKRTSGKSPVGKGPPGPPPGKTSSPGRGAASSGSRRDATAPLKETSPAVEEFDPLDVLGGSDRPPSGKSSPAVTPKPKPEQDPETPLPPREEEFDPLSVLGAGAASKPAVKVPPAGESKTVAGSASAARDGAPASQNAGGKGDGVTPRPKRPDWAKPLPEDVPQDQPAASDERATAAEVAPSKPKRPSWAKPLPDEAEAEVTPPVEETPAGEEEPPPYKPKRPSWAKPLPEEPAAEEFVDPLDSPDRPKPKRPSWAKPLPSETEASGSPTAAAVTDAAPPRPKRPSWAKPLPGEELASGDDSARDLSPAARAAAAAMEESIATVSGDNPALQAPPPKRPWIDVPALVAGIRRRSRLMAKTVLIGIVLFGVSWAVVAPRRVTFQVIGANDRLSLVPVDGRVTMNGKPLEGARVIFQPRGQDSRGKPISFRSPEAITNAEGQYRLKFCDGYWGAPPGRYRVQIVSVGSRGRDIIPAEFGLFTTQQHEVTPSGATIDINIEPQRKR